MTTVGDETNNEQEISQRVDPSIIAPLSKSWSIERAHVPTFTGGKVTHCRTRGLPKQVADDDDSSLRTSWTPFMLLPVSGDLALVDTQHGTTVRTVRNLQKKTTQDDDDDDDGMDEDAITGYALSWDDRTLMTCSSNHLVRQYSLSYSSIDLLKTWGKSGHTLPVTHMEFHGSNVFLATASVDGTVRIWDVRGGYVTHVFRPLAMDSGGLPGVTCITWHQDTLSLILAIGRDNGSTCIHDLRQQDASNPIVVLKDHVSAVTCLQWPDFSFDGPTIFLSAGRDAVIHTYQIKQETQQGKKKKKKGTPKLVYQRIHTIPIYEQVEAMVIVPHSSLMVATAGSKGIVRLWHATVTDNTVGSFTQFAEQPTSQAFGEDRGGFLNLLYLAKEGGEGHLIVADAEHNLSFLSKRLSLDRTIVGHNDEVLDLKLIPSSRNVVVATNSPQVRLFDLDTFSCTVLDGHTATVLCVDTSPCGQYLATCGKDKTMRLWQDTECIAVATGHTEAVGAVALSRKVGRYQVGGKAARNGGGAFCVTASKDKTLKRWNLLGPDEYADSMVELRAFVSARAHEKDINIVTVAPNDSLIATGSQDKTVKLWRSTDLSLYGTLKGHKRGVWDCCFSPFDRVLASCSGDRTIKLWSLADCSCVRTFQGHLASVLRVRFLSGGLQLLSCGADGLVKLWTIRTNECEATMDGHNDKVWALDFDGSALVTGGADSRIVVWRDTTQEEETAKREEEEKNILMEQRLSNHLRHKEFEQALDIALDLDKPRSALKVLTMIIEDSVQKGTDGLSVLQRHVSDWSMERTTHVLRYCRDWNTAARNSHIAMIVFKAIVTSIPAHDLAAANGVPEILAGIVPYAERHYDRLDRLHTSSYLLDYTLFSMGGLESEESYETWESNSKLVLPPKTIDGRIQVGGAAVVGARDTKQVDSESGSDDEVITLGESDDDSSSSEDSSDNDESMGDADAEKDDSSTTSSSSITTTASSSVGDASSSSDS